MYFSGTSIGVWTAWSDKMTNNGYKKKQKENYVPYLYSIKKKK